MLFVYEVSGSPYWGYNKRRNWANYTNVFNDIVNGETDHPHENPESLINRLLLNHCKVGGTVLDPFCGSGTTIKVAVQNGMNCLGIEKSNKWFDVARERVENIHH